MTNYTGTIEKENKRANRRKLLHRTTPLPLAASAPQAQNVEAKRRRRRNDEDRGTIQESINVSPVKLSSEWLFRRIQLE